MKLKSLVLAVAVLAVLSAAAAWLTRTPAPAAADPRVGRPIAEAAAFASASRIRVAYEGATIELARQADGTWTMPGHHDMAVDFNKLSQLFAFFTNEKIQRAVTSNPDTISRLGFDGTKITVFDAAGREAWAVSLGKDSGSGGRYIRFGDEPRAFHTEANILLDANPANWADSYLVNLRNEEIARVELDFPAENATLVASRQKPADVFTASNPPAGRTLRDGVITRILGADAVVRFQEHLDPTDARVAEPRTEKRTVRFTTFGGRTVEIQLSRKPPEKVVRAPGTPADKSGPSSLLGSGAAGSGPADSIASDTTEPGPVFVVVKDSDPKARVNALMQKRAFQVQDFALTSLPQNLDEVFSPAAGTP